MELKPGLKLKAAGTSAEFIVISGPAREVELTCAGAHLTVDGSGGAGAPAVDADLLIGKRYSDDEGTIELLCTVSGAGPLVYDGRLLGAKAAKALPSSD